MWFAIQGAPLQIYDAEGKDVGLFPGPSDTRDVIGEYAQANVEQARHAIAAASHAFRAWSVTTPQQRFDVLEAAATCRPAW